MNRKPLVKQFFRGNKSAFCIAAICALLLGGLNLVASWLMQQMIDTISGVPGARDLKVLAIMTVGLIVSIIFLGGVEYLTKPRFLKKAMLQYKNYAFEKLTQKSIHSFRDEAAATYISALSNDATSVEANYLEKLFGLLSCVVMFVGAFVMMIAYNPLLTVIAVCLTFLPVLASLLVGKRLETAELCVSDQNKSFIDTLKESLGGFSVVKSFKAERAILELFRKNNEAVEEAKCRKRKIEIAIGTIAAVAGTMAQLGVFIIGAYLVVSAQNVTPGVVMVFVNLMNFVIELIAALPEIWANRKASMALMDKLTKALNENVSEGGEEIQNCLQYGIEMKQLSFAYKEGEEVLHGVSLCFEAGKSYALVGTSGSGKSTLLNLLLASHDTYGGSICYDNHELRNISSRSLYDLVSVVQQNVVIFNASVRDNITMFSDVSKGEVDRVIEQAGLSAFIEEHGEDYLCGENGNALSGGERQRISIARSLLRKSSVLLVDEATASLDAQTAYQVSNSILDIEGVTRIVVTHSLEEALLKRHDEIIVLKSGNVVETGSFEELMSRKEYFYSLYTVSQ